MSIEKTNRIIVDDYAKTATMQNAIIFCALSENENGKINIYMSKMQHATATVAMLRKIANDLELKAQGN